MLLISFTTAASAAHSADEKHKITESQITSNISNQEDPAIFMDKIVWEDERNGNSDVYMYDLSTKKESQITSDKSNQKNPEIFGDTIIWMDDRNGGSWDENHKPIGNWDVYMYDLSTKKEKRITTDDSTQWNPEMYGSTIVWQDSRNGDQDIFMYDLSTSQETQVAANISNQNNPGIYGDSIVWTDESDGNKDIYKGDSSKYNLFNTTTTEIIKKAPKGSKGGCSEKMVMVVKEFTGIYNVYMYDLSNSAETKAPPNASFFENLDLDLTIKADDLVLVDSRYDTNKKCNVDTYELLDSELAKGKTDTKSDEIILEESSDDGKSLNNRDTRMCDASGKGRGQKQPAANFFATPISGEAPLKVKFTDKSTGTPETWHWNFGDGTYSKTENPVHTYSKAGNYTVKLKTSNDAGADTKTKSNYIKVEKA